jgi:hypothetical protein
MPIEPSTEGPPRIYWFTYSNKMDVGLCHLAASVAHYGGVLHVLGLDTGAEPRESKAAAESDTTGRKTSDTTDTVIDCDMKSHWAWDCKLKYLHRILDTALHADQGSPMRIEDDDLLLFSDGFDVLAQRNLRELGAAFDQHPFGASALKAVEGVNATVLQALRRQEPMKPPTKPPITKKPSVHKPRHVLFNGESNCFPWKHTHPIAHGMDFQRGRDATLELRMSHSSSSLSHSNSNVSRNVSVPGGMICGLQESLFGRSGSTQSGPSSTKRNAAPATATSSDGTKQYTQYNTHDTSEHDTTKTNAHGTAGYNTQFPYLNSGLYLGHATEVLAMLSDALSQFLWFGEDQGIMGMAMLQRPSVAVDADASLFQTTYGYNHWHAAQYERDLFGAEWVVGKATEEGPGERTWVHTHHDPSTGLPPRRTRRKEGGETEGGSATAAATGGGAAASGSRSGGGDGGGTSGSSSDGVGSSSDGVILLPPPFVVHFNGFAEAQLMASYRETVGDRLVQGMYTRGKGKGSADDDGPYFVSVRLGKGGGSSSGGNSLHARRVYLAARAAAGEGAGGEAGGSGGGAGQGATKKTAAPQFSCCAYDPWTALPRCKGT